MDYGVGRNGCDIIVWMLTWVVCNCDWRQPELGIQFHFNDDDDAFPFQSNTIGFQYLNVCLSPFSDNNVHAQGWQQQMANKTVQQRYIVAGTGCCCYRAAWRFNSFGARANETECTFASWTGTVNKETLSSHRLWRGNHCVSVLSTPSTLSVSPTFFLSVSFAIHSVQFSFSVPIFCILVSSPLRCRLCYAMAQHISSSLSLIQCSAVVV